MKSYYISADLPEPNTNNRIIRIQLTNTCIEEMEELWNIGDKYPISEFHLKRLGLSKNDKLIISDIYKKDDNNVWINMLVR